MSEPKKASELIMERLEKIEKFLAAPKESPKTSTEHKHIHSPNVQFECDGCEKLYVAEVEKQLRPKLEKEIKEKFRSGDYVTCDGCGEIVDKEAEECPTCHGKTAH